MNMGSSPIGDDTGIWRYTTTTELLYLLEENALYTSSINELSLGCDIPHADSFENMADRVWKELKQVVKYTEWYLEPEVSHSTWNRFSNATIALKSSIETLRSQLPNQTACLGEAQYTVLEEYSIRLSTDGRGNYPVTSLCDIFGVKSSNFDNEKAIRAFVLPDGLLDKSNEMYSYTDLASYEGCRPEISIEPEDLILDLKVSPNAPPYTENVLNRYLVADLGVDHLMADVRV